MPYIQEDEKSKKKHKKKEKVEAAAGDDKEKKKKRPRSKKTEVDELEDFLSGVAGSVKRDDDSDPHSYSCSHFHSTQ
ncbi:hypothetical protein ILYODFUR_031850 [Ilyodon furcidens]|uniref:Uncharacterized protein n=1 Tax=Ilyodon furcidens TaxID=33524 RepID=A0ABV0UWZ8_9TELE